MAKLGTLQQDFTATMGRAFTHFFCPILFKDEPASLSLAHVIPEAFPHSDRSRTVQRTDVDQFFGAFFEADFTLLAQNAHRDTLHALADSKLSGKFRPRLYAGDTPVEHYRPKSEVPPQHSQVTVLREDLEPIRLALKLSPDETLSLLGRRWSIDLQADLRLAALVGLLKAAHLTLFHLLGYGYALSAAGRFLGWDVLGAYASANVDSRKAEAIRAATRHFPQFVNMVRPMLLWPEDLTGTVSDRLLYICTGFPKPWALLVLIRTGRDMHCVVVPIMEDAEGAARFVRFLKVPSARFEVRLAKLCGDKWEVAKEGRVIDWPKAEFA